MTNNNARGVLSEEIRRLQKTQALLIAVQFASNHDAEFDVSDAPAPIVASVEESLRALDKLELLLSSGS